MVHHEAPVRLLHVTSLAQAAGTGRPKKDQGFAVAALCTHHVADEDIVIAGRHRRSSRRARGCSPFFASWRVRAGCLFPCTQESLFLDGTHGSLCAPKSSCRPPGAISFVDRELLLVACCKAGGECARRTKRVYWYMEALLCVSSHTRLPSFRSSTYNREEEKEGVKLRNILSVFVLFGLTAVTMFAADQTWTGKISDSMCGASHKSATEHGGKKMSDRDCALACIKEHQAKYVFVNNGKVLNIANQDAAGLEEHAGHTVNLTGALDGDTITVSKIEMSGQ